MSCFQDFGASLQPSVLNCGCYLCCFILRISNITQWLWNNPLMKLKIIICKYKGRDIFTVSKGLSWLFWFFNTQSILRINFSGYNLCPIHYGYFFPSWSLWLVHSDSRHALLLCLHKGTVLKQGQLWRGTTGEKDECTTLVYTLSYACFIFLHTVFSCFSSHGRRWQRRKNSTHFSVRSLSFPCLDRNRHEIIVSSSRERCYFLRSNELFVFPLRVPLYSVFFKHSSSKM